LKKLRTAHHCVYAAALAEVCHLRLLLIDELMYCHLCVDLRRGM